MTDIKHDVVVTLGGETYTKELGPGVNFMLFGNIVFGGFIGIIVDTATGAHETLYPGSVDAEFNEKTAAAARAEPVRASSYDPPPLRNHDYSKDLDELRRALD